MVAPRPRRLRRGLAAMALTCAALAGCGQFWLETGAWDIGEHRGLLLDVSNYYHRHATEEGGRCRSPILEGIGHAEATEISDDLLDVHIRYHYRDFLKNGDDCDRRFRRLRCGIFRECTGFAARDFRVARTEDGFEVIDMSGGRRR